MKISKEYTDLKKDAIRHIKFIIKCCHEFDEGERESMFHATTSLRAFFKQNKNTKSILHLLKIEDKTLIDIAGIGKPVSLIPMFAGALSFPDYIPNLNSENKKLLEFSEWYEGLVLFAPESYKFSRKDLILELGEQYVQHVDKSVTKDFHSLYNNVDNYIGWDMYEGGILVKQPNIVYSVLRMICNELIFSLDYNNIDLVDYKNLYFSKLKRISPHKPFGNHTISIIDKSSVTMQFFQEKDGQKFKLPISGEYALTHNKNKVPILRDFFKYQMDKIIQESVYEYIENDIQSGQKEFYIDKTIELESESIGVIHTNTKKIHPAKKLNLEFTFKIQVS